MRPDVKKAYRQELALAQQARRERNLDQAVAHLERAHILGQRSFFPHFHTHLRLLAVATERADSHEMAGQIIRVIAVIPGYLTGWVPKGNTGSANVSALQPMTPPADLAPLLADHSPQDLRRAADVAGFGPAKSLLFGRPPHSPPSKG